MHECDGTECWLSGWCCVNAPRQSLVDFALVQRTQLHPEVVRMLAIVQRLTLVRLSSLQEQWIAAFGDGQRIEAEHRPSLEATASEVASSHQHSPVQRAELVVTALAALFVVLSEHEAVRHQHPVT